MGPSTLQRSPTPRATPPSPGYSPVTISFVAAVFVMLTLKWFIRGLGFAPNGVRPNSPAAHWQSLYYGAIPARSAFAHLQTWGRLGLDNVEKALVGLAVFSTVYSFLK